MPDCIERLGIEPVDIAGVPQARLFAPLGMERAGFGPPGDAARVDQPWGHRRQGEKTVPLFFDNPSSLGPAGTVHASLEDWAKFAALHLGDARLQTAAWRV